MFASHRFAIAVGSAFVCLASTGCAGQTGSGVPYGAPGLIASNGDTFDRTGARSFLYVSDAGSGYVQVYNWPKPGKNPIATLTGFSEPQGLCSDGNNAYITSTTAGAIVEYAAGASTPSRTIDDPYGLPIACSVDPVSGDLAVSNILSESYGAGSLAIYPKAQGKPRKVTSKRFQQFGFVQYDGSGNLFIEGSDSQFTSNYAEIPAGSKRIKVICSNSQSAEFTDSLGWDGTYIVRGGTNGVYRTKVCKTVGFTPLTGGSDVIQFTIAGNALIAPDAGNLNVGIYPYPKGGAAELTLSGFSQPIGATVVSRAPSNHR
jgi:hypothetical protein